MKNILVIGNIFESRSLLVNAFCGRDDEVIANRISSRISGSAIVVSAISAFLRMNATLVAKVKSNYEFEGFISKLRTLGINTTQIDLSAVENNILITIYDSKQDRICYSYLPAQIQTSDILDIDYSLYDAVFFCCLPYTVVEPVFSLNPTIGKTQSVILASGLTPEYFNDRRLKINADFVFCNRGELFNILGENEENDREVLDDHIDLVLIENATLVVTMGKNGVVVAKDRLVYRVSVPEVKRIVHPGGAGDSFATGFICGILEKKTIEECCFLGHQCSEQMLAVYSVNEFIERIMR